MQESISAEIMEDPFRVEHAALLQCARSDGIVGMRCLNKEAFVGKDDIEYRTAGCLIEIPHG